MDNIRIQAAKAGETRYYGRPCRKCGNRERLTSTGGCIPCSRAHSRRYREEIRSLLAEASKKQVDQQ